jgi:hypothetical protein
MKLELASFPCCSYPDARVELPDPKVFALESTFYPKSVYVLHVIEGEDGVSLLGSNSFPLRVR